jgi:tRNA(Arg) A34 adenosine deaminase TadA
MKCVFLQIVRWTVSLAFTTSAHGLHRRDVTPQQAIYSSDGLTINSISYSTRAHWMRRANSALAELSSPCPFAAFAAVIVNHTDTSSIGEEICIGVNSNSALGNPTLHGEIAAINNCSAELQGPRFNLTPAAALNAMKTFSLYTNAESCPMCASAIRWAGFREYIYGTTIDYLIEKGWGQIRISSLEVFQESFDLPNQSRLIADVLRNETDPYFAWQFDPAVPCPAGCARGGTSGECVAS